MDLAKSRNDLRDSVAILEDNIGLFHAGRWHAYRVVAVELRKLLCDGRDGSNALIPRIWNPVRLHPLPAIARLPMDDAVTFQMPAFASFDGKGGYVVERIFDERSPLIELEEWLEQPFLSQKVTIREFVKSAAEKEGAHSDKNFNDTLLLTYGLCFLDEPLHKALLVGIAEYVIRVIAPALLRLDQKAT